MIEFCSERRMFVAIGLLGGVTLLVLILEGRWTWSATSARSTISPSSSLLSATNTSCWLREDYEVLEECHPCTESLLESQQTFVPLTCPYFLKENRHGFKTDTLKGEGQGDFEVASKSIKECIPTKYKEVIRCKSSGKAVRSCLKVVWLEQRNFWVFEAVSFGGAILSSLAVYVRQRQLDRRMMKRLQAQLSSCA